MQGQGMWDCRTRCDRSYRVLQSHAAPHFILSPTGPLPSGAEKIGPVGVARSVFGLSHSATLHIVPTRHVDQSVTRDSTPASRFSTPGFGVLWHQTPGTPGSRLHRPCKHGILTISPIHGSKTIRFQWLTGYRLFSVVVSCKWVQSSLFSSTVSTQQFSM